MQEINKIDEIIKSLQSYKKDIKKKEKISNTLFEAGYDGMTRKRRNNMGADLNWLCMNLDKDHKRIWIKMKEYFETDTGEREYSPSPFHTYKG